MNAESRKAFFKQSGWMVIATTAGGVFMTAVHSVAAKMPTEEYTVFFVLLRCLIVLGIPTAGLQTVFAQQAAAVVTESEKQKLRRTTRSVLASLFVGWAVLCCATFFEQNAIIGVLKMKNSRALWVTMFVVLTSLVLPVFRGILQGEQNFLGMGWVAIFDGVGRFLAIALIVLVLHGEAAGAMGGAVLGQIAALSFSLWWTRDLLTGIASSFHWREWFNR
jgi:O-antigen/teichoic acid export membrane protein